MAIDWTNFDEVKNVIIYILVAIGILNLICVCGICGFMRTRKHEEPRERKVEKPELPSPIHSPSMTSEPYEQKLKSSEEPSLREKYLSQMNKSS